MISKVKTTDHPKDQNNSSFPLNFENISSKVSFPLIISQMVMK